MKPSRALLLVPLLHLSGSCGYFFPAAYEAAIEVGPRLTSLVNEVGPISLRATLTGMDVNEGGDPLLTAMRGPLVEICEDADGDRWLRSSVVKFRPEQPRPGNTASLGVYSAGELGDWQAWPDGNETTTAGTISVTIGGGASFCSSAFELGVVVEPLGPAFRDGDEAAYNCRQADSAPDGVAEPIASGPTLQFEATCEAGLTDVVQVGVMPTEGQLRDLAENYPPGSPTPGSFTRIIAE